MAADPTGDFVPDPPDPADEPADGTDAGIREIVRCAMSLPPVREWKEWDVYHLHEPCDTSGQGVVFRASHKQTGEQVAVKIVCLGQGIGSIAQLLAEAQRTSQLSKICPSVVDVKDVRFDPQTGSVGFVMEWLNGKSVAEMVPVREKAERVVLPWQKAYRTAVDVLTALEFCHNLKIVHLDIKPANVFRTFEPEATKLLDFGLAVHFDPLSGNPHRAAGRGTPDYMAPEQFEPGVWKPEGCAEGVPVGPHSDTYAVGAVLYHMLTGEPPFYPAKHILHLLDAHRNGDPDPRRVAAVEEHCKTVIAKAMAKNPAHRYQSATEFRQDLERYLAADVPTHGPPKSVVDPPEVKSRSSWGVLTLAAIMGLLAVVAVAAFPGMFRDQPTVTGDPPDEGFKKKDEKEAPRKEDPPPRVSDHPVREFEVRRVTPTKGGPNNDTRIIGKSTAEVGHGDNVYPVAAFDGDVYSYLVALYPSGEVQLFFPANEVTFGTLGSRPDRAIPFPAANPDESQPFVSVVPTDGTGLMAVVLLTARVPPPAVRAACEAVCGAAPCVRMAGPPVTSFAKLAGLVSETPWPAWKDADGLATGLWRWRQGELRPIDDRSGPPGLGPPPTAHALARHRLEAACRHLAAKSEFTSVDAVAFPVRGAVPPAAGKHP